MMTMTYRGPVTLILPDGSEHDATADLAKSGPVTRGLERWGGEVRGDGGLIWRCFDEFGASSDTRVRLRVPGGAVAEVVFGSPGEGVAVVRGSGSAPF